MKLRSIEVVVEKDGTVHLPQKLKLSAPRRGILTILDEPPSTFLYGGTILVGDWSRPEEDRAWAYLQLDI